MMTVEPKGHGIQSLELGLDILKKIAEQDKPLTITEIAVLCEMSKSKLHRYLTSFCRSGFLLKHEDLRYSLGTELILLGLKASNKLDIKDISQSYLSALREDLNETVALAIWGENGPFYLLWEASNRVVNIGIKAGSQVGVVQSAPGKLFAAYLPTERTEGLITTELVQTGIHPESFWQETNEIRRKGFSLTEGTVVPGITAVSCPIFNQNGEITAALTLVTMVGGVDISEHSESIQKLKQTSMNISKALGYKPVK